jgi:glycine hydroxymethyltransferase
MTDKEYIFGLIEVEKQRQEDEICLIASENYMSEDVMKGCGSVFINDYSEGYSGHRYYGGKYVVDKLEDKANELACKLFNCKWSNVQPSSGSQANQAVYLALCKAGDTILGMDLNAGGHLTHGSKVSSSGKLYNAISYGLDENGYLNYNEIEQKLYEYNPKLLIVGASAYPRIIDFERIRKIVNIHDGSRMKEYLIDHPDTIGQELIDKFKTYIMVDMAHIAGLVATGLHPSPLPYADVVTSTVQKTLRSGRGGLILSNNEELSKKIDKAVFPGIQGGPLVNMIAGKAIGFTEALTPEFRTYQQQVLKNIQVMVEVFKENDIKMITNGSDNHLILLDLKDEKFSGKDLETVLEKQGIITNKNAVQGDTRPKTETSGLRIGTACITTRGMKETQAKTIANIIATNIKLLRQYDGIPDKEFDIHCQIVKSLCRDFPIYKD